jgi:hypothetical protein
MHTAGPFVLESSSSEIGVDIVNLKRCKSTDVDHILAELIQAGGETVLSLINKLKLIWKKSRIVSPVESFNCRTYSKKW